MAYFKCGQLYVTANSAASTYTASGAIANFDTQLAMPMSLKAYIEATQASGTPTPSTPLPISGWDSVKVGLTSDKASYFKGLLSGTCDFVDLGSLTYIKITLSNNREAFHANINQFTNYPLVNKDAPNCICSEYPTTYQTASAWGSNVCLLTEGSGVLGSGFSVILPSGTYQDETAFKNAMQGEYLIYELVDSITPTITPEQFATLCTAFGINGTEVIISLGQTVYGGYVTQDKDGHRELVVSWAYELIKNLSWSRNKVGSWNAYYFYASIDDKKYLGALNCECYLFTNKNTSNADDLSIISGNNNYVYIRDDSFADTNDFVNTLGNYKIAYELNTPIIIPLADGEPLNALIGTNNHFADSGDSEVIYTRIGAPLMMSLNMNLNSINSEEPPIEEPEDT